MKVVKYILAGLFILGGVGSLASGAFGAGLLTAILGVLFLPPISSTIKLKLPLWQNKAIRYISYLILLVFIALFIPKNVSTDSEAKAKKEHTSIIKQSENTTNLEILNFKTCNYAGGGFYIIPNMIAADVYANFQERDFKIVKNINNDGTDIHCELSTSDVKYDVVITGCTPNKIISVEAMATDYSGNNLEAVKSFIGFVATLEYDNSNPKQARKWIENNINNDGAQTTIGGVTFSINFKSKYSKSFSMQIDK